MAVSAKLKSLKMKLKMAECTVTISRCNANATDSNIKIVAQKINELRKDELQKIYKVQEYTLIQA